MNGYMDVIIPEAKHNPNYIPYNEVLKQFNNFYGNTSSKGLPYL
jgi:hypothetical protein